LIHLITEILLVFSKQSLVIDVLDTLEATVSKSYNNSLSFFLLNKEQIPLICIIFAMSFPSGKGRG